MAFVIELLDVIELFLTVYSAWQLICRIVDANRR